MTNAQALEVGQAVICNGYRATVLELCTGNLEGMCIVMVPGGRVCVSVPEVIRFNAEKFLRGGAL